MTLPLTIRRGYDAVPEVVLGAGLRQRLSPRFFAVAGRRLVHLDVRPAVAVGIGIDAGAGVQVTPQLAIVLETRLAELTVVGQIDRTATVLDTLPATLSALLALGGRLDVTFEARADSLRPRDDLSLAIGVRGRN